MVPWETREQDIDEHLDEERDKTVEGDKSWEGYQDMDGDENWEDYQDMEEDNNLVEVGPRILAPLPEIHFSPHAPMLSSVLGARRTPKYSVKNTTADNLRPCQYRHPSSPRHRRSHAPQTPTGQ